MKKALVVATVGRFYRFLRSDMEILKEAGYEVHCATNLCLGDSDGMEGFAVVKHQVDFARSPFSVANGKAFVQLQRLLREMHFDLVHCHTPMGSMLGRLAAEKYRKSGTKVFYTAHGFHFYKGAPFRNWLLYFSAEWVGSFWTDALITINREDYLRAKRHLHAKQTFYIPGIGIDREAYGAIGMDKAAKRKSLGVKEDEFMILTVGELSRRKNQGLVIDALAQMRLKNVKYFLCGEGAFQKRYQRAIRRKGLGGKVTLLGQREDVGELCKAADLFLLPSRQEGVSVALMEAIACKTPVICSRIRGSVELVADKSCMFAPDRVEGLVQVLQKKLCAGKRDAVADRQRFHARMRASVEENYRNLQRFDIQKTAKRTREIYIRTCCNGK